MMKRAFAAAVLSAAALCPAQTLYQYQPAPGPVGTEGHGADAAVTLYGMSMMAVQPPRPRTYRQHDLVTIIVDETSKLNAEQTLKTDKKYDISAEIGAIIDPWELLELRLKASSIEDLKLIEAAYKAKFDGKGTFERSDRFSMKIQAEIIDVKPNGVLVLEARKYVDKNGEMQTTVLSGSCRQADITQNNTIFSGQLANLSLATKTEGQVNDAGRKGLITRALETVFAF